MCFLFAPNYNKAFKNVAKVRKELTFRTIFNLLGPLLNPVRAKRQLLGVFSNKYLKVLAETLQAQDSIKSWVVNGSDGMDEITLTGNTQIAELSNNKIKEFEINPKKYNFTLCSHKIKEFEINPKKYNFTLCSPESLKGGEPAYNAKKMLHLFEGEKSSYRDIVVLNTAAAFCVADSVNNYGDGIELAQTLLDEGKALNTLNKLIKVSNQ